MKTLLASILLGFFAAITNQWWIRTELWKQSRLEPTMPTVPTAPAKLASEWLSTTLGEPGTPPAVAKLQSGLNRWGISKVEGWDLLGLPVLGGLARLELERWFELGPGAGSEGKSLRLNHRPNLHCLELELEIQGSSAAILPLLTHLLEMPIGRGYLTDPASVQLRSHSDGIALNLVIRVFSAKQLAGLSG